MPDAPQMCHPWTPSGPIVLTSPLWCGAQDAAVRVIAKMPMITAMVYRSNLGLPVAYPNADLDYTENFLRMMFENPMYKSSNGMNRIYTDEVYK